MQTLSGPKSSGEEFLDLEKSENHRGGSHSFPDLGKLSSAKFGKTRFNGEREIEYAKFVRPPAFGNGISGLREIWKSQGGVPKIPLT